MTIFLRVIVLVSLVSGKDPRIVGGTKVYDTTTFPWIVSLLYNDSTLAGLPYFEQHGCAGSIIDQFWILTAAHCLYSRQAHEISVLAGTYNLSNMDMGFLSKVSEVYRHQNFSSSSLKNDIALLKLEKPINLSDSVAVIHLAEEKDPRNSGQIYTVAGWGATNMKRYRDPWGYQWDFTYGPILKTVEVADLSRRECLRKSGQNVPEEDFDTLICAEDEVGEGTCRRDSGGPVTMTVNSTDILYGIVSRGLWPCGTKPALYTKVAAYQDWIANRVLSNPSSPSSFQSNASSPSSFQSNAAFHVVISLVAGIIFFSLIIIFCRYTAHRKQQPKNEHITEKIENL